jgi:type III secretion protein J
MKYFLSVLALLFLVGCETNQSIAHNVDEREANEIVVFLASKGIVSQKVAAATSGAGAGNAPTNLYDINVDAGRSTEAMALLNRHGLPRQTGQNLLTIFAKSGLMSSDREETIRYQAGLAEELKNTILKIDGIIDADVQLSFPPSDTTPLPGAPTAKTTAAVYIKHQGVMEDPNSHLEMKIKRFLAGSVNGLDYENVSVISDRARLSDIQINMEGEVIGAKQLQQTYVSIWGVVMTKSSLARFRTIFFLFIGALVLFAAAIGYLIYRFYPLMRKTEETPGPEI